MRQADIKRMERAVIELEKAINNLDVVAENLWRDTGKTRYMRGRTYRSLVMEASLGITEERQNLNWLVEAIKETGYVE